MIDFLGKDRNDKMEIKCAQHSTVLDVLETFAYSILISEGADR